MGGTGGRKLAAVGLAAFAIFAGCNVFEPFASKSDGALDYTGLVIRGNDALDAGNYAQAESLFAAAQQKNPAGSEAYLFHAQAIVAEYHLDFNRLQDEFDCKRSTRNTARCLAENIDTTGVPFIHPGVEVENIDSIYYPIVTAVTDLNHIIRLKTDTIYEGNYALPPDGDTASDGVVSPGVARLDLGLLLAVDGVLAPLDLDGNHHTDRHCGAAITSDSLRLADCPDGDSSESERLHNFIKLTQNIHLDSLSSDDVNARDISVNPNDINAFITSIQVPISGSVYNLDSVTHSLQNHNDTALTGEIQGAVDNVNDLSNFLGYMHYNDGIDDDYDAQEVANPTPMRWHNFDRDADPTGAYQNHGIRYDYDDGMDFNVFPLGSGDIGHPIHRNLHPNLYLTFSQWGKAFPKLAADTSKNSRFALERKKCRDMVNALTANAWVAAHLDTLNKTCDSVSTVLQATVTPPLHSDWISGTAGVDEELIDNFDNDYDGIKDEDGRNLVGYDDDDDALLDVGMIDSVSAGHPLTPMQWHDVAGHANQCADIDTTLPMDRGTTPAGVTDAKVLYHYRRINCIGTLENRLYFERNHPDSLAVYYSPYLDAGNPNPFPPDSNCEDDYNTMDPTFRTLWGATQSAVDSACHYKHIWVAPIPPRSEWTGGVFGIDEEKLDGIDNDGDGWIDEDVDVSTTK